MPVSPFKSEASKAAVMEVYEKRLAAWPAPVRELDLATPGGKTHVIAGGLPSGLPVLLLHGGQANSMMWQPYMHWLAPEFRLFALDAPWAPGKGEFDGQWPESPGAWIGSVMDGLELPRAALMGFSMGGAMAMASLAALADRVAALICISSGPGGFAPKPSLILPSILASILKTRGAYRRMIRIAAPSGRIDAETMEYFLRFQQHCVAPSRPPESHPVLPEGMVKTPALFFFGGKDATFDAARATAMVGESFSRAAVETMPEAEHMLFIEEPETVFPKAAEFLRGIGQGA
jgi:pimeloyl-ACP methyl ester carboxylesterase